MRRLHRLVELASLIHSAHLRHSAHLVLQARPAASMMRPCGRAPFIVVNDLAWTFHAATSMSDSTLRAIFTSPSVDFLPATCQSHTPGRKSIMDEG